MSEVNTPKRICENVYLIKEGELRRGRDIIKYASSSVALVLTEDGGILLDTALESDFDLLKERLESISLGIDDIKAIINTHLHYDHIGCNKFFRCSKYAHRIEIDRRRGELDHSYKSCEDFRLEVGEESNIEVTIIETFGHCYGHISVLCRDKTSNKIVAFAGDAIPRKNNFLQDIPPRIHVDRKSAVESMNKIKRIADVIIPGHDLPIEVK